MQTSLQTSPLYSSLLGDAEIAAELGCDAEHRSMIAVEIALALAQSELGTIPANVGPELQSELANFTVDQGAMAAGILSSGVPVPALVVEMRKSVSRELGQWVHWGATSQDIVDSAAMLQTARCLDILERRLASLIGTLEAMAHQYSDVVMSGRTRSQMATPTTLGLRIAGWAQPLIELERDLTRIKEQVLRLQFGGAVGANSAVAPHGPQISHLMAAHLGLSDGLPWHTNRLGIHTLAGWLLSISVALSKIAKDLMISARSEIAELHAGTAGGSSTMPQKANPVQAEVIAAMGVLAASMHAGLIASGSPTEERDGASWTVEWIFLPQLILTVGCALRHSLAIAETLEPDQARMLDNMARNPGIMAEAASFALAQHMPRAEAQALVKQAVLSGRPLAATLTELCEAPIDWAQVLDPQAVFAPCRQIIEQTFNGRKPR